MTISSEELNYLIWRYLQETGHEVAALALQESSRVLEFDKSYGSHIPIGCLVNFIQKGILYTESEYLVAPDGSVYDDSHYRDRFTLMHALNVEETKFPLSKDGRFMLEREDEEEPTPVPEMETVPEDPQFSVTLKEQFSYDASSSCEWNPIEPKVLAWGSRDGAAKIAVVSESTQIISLPHPHLQNVQDITCVSWCPQGSTLVTAQETGELRLWSADGRLQNVLSLHRNPVVSCKWNSSGSHILSHDVGGVTIAWNVSSGVSVNHHETNGENSGVDVCWIGNDRYATATANSGLCIFQLGDKQPVATLVGHDGMITALQYNPSNRLLLSASDDKTLRIWNGINYNTCEILKGHTQGVTSCHWLSDNSVISSSLDGSAKLWKLKIDGDAVTTVSVGTTIFDGMPVFSAALSPDKSKYVTGSMDGQVNVFNVDAGHDGSLPLVANYQPEMMETTYVTCVSWSRDSKSIAVSYAAGSSNVIRLG